jgi:Leucine-rich repeat (LRR) protein
MKQKIVLFIALLFTIVIGVSHVSAQTGPPVGTPYLEMTTAQDATIKLRVSAVSGATLWSETSPGKFVVIPTTNNLLTFTVSGSKMRIWGKVQGLLCMDNGDNLTGIDISQSNSVRTLWCRNNNLTYLNAANGKNALFDSGNVALPAFDATENPKLNYIVIDSNFDRIPTQGSKEWRKDDTAEYVADSPPQGTAAVELTTSADADINVGMETLSNPFVWIETAPGKYIVEHLTNTITKTYAVSGNKLRLYGDISQIFCSNNGTKLIGVDISKNPQIRTIWCENNDLTYVNTANGNNALFDSGQDSKPAFNAMGNARLKYIFTDPDFDPTSLTGRKQWKKDASTEFVQLPKVGEPVIEMTTTPNASIAFSMKAGADNTPIWVETAPGVFTYITVGKQNTEELSFDVSGTTLKVHGAVTSFISSVLNYDKLIGLDVSQNTNLTYLNCSYSKITSLDLSKNTKLTNLDCSYSKLTALDLSNNPDIATLNCSSNDLTSLNTTNCAKLTTLSCATNSLTSLDLTTNTALTILYCVNNKITDLDLSQNMVLRELNCSQNQLKSLDVTKNKSLKKLLCNNNELIYINVANGNNTNFDSGMDTYPAFDATANPDLVAIVTDKGFDPEALTESKEWRKPNSAVWMDDLPIIELTNFGAEGVKLSMMAIAENTPVIIDTSTGTPIILSVGTSWTEQKEYKAAFPGKIKVYGPLVGFDCERNNMHLTELDVSKNPLIANLKCGSNDISQLDLSMNKRLESLDFKWGGSAGLSTLNLSSNSKLNYINCNNAKLDLLDVSNNTELETLLCSDNNLTSLDLRKNTKLRYLNCINNQLTFLVVANGNNVNFSSGSSYANAFDATGNTNLTSIYIDKGFTPPAPGSMVGWKKNTTTSYVEMPMPVGTPYMEMITTPNSEVNLQMEVEVPNTSVWIESEPGIFTEFKLNTVLKEDILVSDTLLRVYGNVISLISKIPNHFLTKILSLDVSKNPGLKKLICSDNKLRTLNVSNNRELEYLDCSLDAYLDVLDVSRCSMLKELICNNANLTELKLPSSNSLINLLCNNNSLTELDLSWNNYLEGIDCSNNKISSLELGDKELLSILYCDDNQLTSLDVRQNTKLTKLSCGNNKLRVLDVSNNTALTSLDCETNQICTLDLSKNKALKFLNCGLNALTFLNVANGNNYNFDSGSTTIPAFDSQLNFGLESIYVDKDFNPEEMSGSKEWRKDNESNYVEVGDTQPTIPPFITLPTKPDTPIKLAVKADAENTRVRVEVGTGNFKILEVGTDWVEGTYSGFKEFSSDYCIMKVHGNVTGFKCDDNPDDVIMELDVSNTPILRELYCSGIGLNVLDLSKNTALTNLECKNNKLTTLDLKNNVALIRLDCSNNLLTAIDVNKQTELQHLNFSNNRIGYFTGYFNLKLTYLNSSVNLLKSFDISKNTALTHLICHDNSLSEQDFSAFTELVQLDCSHNQLKVLDFSKHNKLTALWCNDNLLTDLNVANGNNLNFDSSDPEKPAFDASNNTKLTLIHVDDKFTPDDLVGNKEWRKDATAKWSSLTALPAINSQDSGIRVWGGKGVIKIMPPNPPEMNSGGELGANVQVYNLTDTLIRRQPLGSGDILVATIC